VTSSSSEEEDSVASLKETMSPNQPKDEIVKKLARNMTKEQKYKFRHLLKPIKMDEYKDLKQKLEEKQTKSENKLLDMQFKGWAEN